MQGRSAVLQVVAPTVPYRGEHSWSGDQLAVCEQEQNFGALVALMAERGQVRGTEVTEELLTEISADALVYRLYLAHLLEVRRYVSSLVPISDVDDVVADTFALALTKSHKIPDGLGLPWLLKSARYLANNHRRRASRAALSLDSDEGYAQLPAAGDYFDQSDTAALVMAAMNQLPEKEREAVMLYTFDQLDASQCAKIAGCTPKTYSVRLHRGKAKLRALLAEMNPQLGGELNNE